MTSATISDKDVNVMCWNCNRKTTLQSKWHRMTRCEKLLNMVSTFQNTIFSPIKHPQRSMSLRNPNLFSMQFSLWAGPPSTFYYSSRHTWRRKSKNYEYFIWRLRRLRSIGEKNSSKTSIESRFRQLYDELWFLFWRYYNFEGLEATRWRHKLFHCAGDTVQYLSCQSRKLRNIAHSSTTTRIVSAVDTVDRSM